jgi:hypothetical protein
MERTARPWRWLAVAAVLVTVGAVVTAVWLHYPAGRPEGPQQSVTEPAVVEAAASDATRSQPALQNAERVKLEELRAMSETFRNTSFLIAIRDSGYLCSDLVSVYGGVGDSTTWTAACREMLAYTVRVSHIGTLLVEPTVQYLDAVPGVPLPQQLPQQLQQQLQQQLPQPR